MSDNAIRQRPIGEEDIHHLFELANTLFTVTAFKERWTAFGWEYTPEPNEDFGIFVATRPRDWHFWVSPIGDVITGGALPFYYWENYDPEFAEDEQEYEREKQAYDDIFASTAARAERILPPAFLHWSESHEYGQVYQAVAWEGTYGILILQQACHDPQFGIEINFWLHNGRKEDFQPTEALIDWLNQHMENLRGDNE